MAYRNALSPAFINSRFNPYRDTSLLPNTSAPLLDLSEVPSASSRAGVMPDELRAYEPTWGDTGRDFVSGADAIARDMALAAPRAWVDAYEDPSLANVTNAGVQTGLAFGKPLAAAGALGLGYGTALMKDLGAFDMAASADDMDPLGPRRSRYDALVNKMNKAGGWLAKAEREELMGMNRVLDDAQKVRAQNDAARQAAEDQAKQDEYNRAVLRAEDARNVELGRVRRFSDTETGKVFEKTGGFAPAVLGFGAGALTRAAVGPGTNFLSKAAPAASGALAGVTALNVPLAYNAFMTEPDNPEKAAYTAYARELPPEHPRKTEWQNYADRLPLDNPVRTQAAEELYDPVKLAERVGFGLLEGGLGGQMGKEVIDIPGRIYGALKRKFQTGPGNVTDEFQAASSAKPQSVGDGTRPGSSDPKSSRPNYRDLSQDQREDVRSAYRDTYKKMGMLRTKYGAELIKEKMSDLGVNVPVTPARIKATNNAVEQFISINGREPSSKADWAKIFNDKTLGLAGAGFGASMLMDGADSPANALEARPAQAMDPALMEYLRMQGLM